MLSLLLAALVIAAVAAPGAAALAADTALVALYVVPAQIVQAALGQLVLVRIRSALRRASAMVGIWVAVLASLAFLLPLLLGPSAGVGLSAVVGLAEVVLLAAVRGGIVGLLDLDRRAPLPTEVAPGASEQAAPRDY